MDSEILISLIPRVVEVLKNGVGLATKVASANFVVSLVHRCMHDLTPYAGEYHYNIIFMLVISTCMNFWYVPLADL